MVTTLPDMPDRLTAPASARTAVVWQVLEQVLDERSGGTTLDVLDAGGGTGGFAVPLAQLGHRVTVVDPSPDSLAALRRRAAEAGVAGQVTARQGDAAGLLEVADPAGYDVVLCHSVLEVVDDPAAALAAVAAAVRPGGTVSVLAATRTAAVLGRVLAGRVAEAARLLDDPAGRAGPGDPLLRRFDLDGLSALIEGAGLQVHSVHGVRVFTELVPGQLLEGEPGAAAAITEVEHRVAHDPAFYPLAAQLQVIAGRPQSSHPGRG